MSQIPADGGRTTQISIIRTTDAPVRAVACVVVIQGERLGRRANIDRRRIVVGRSDDADLVIRHSSVSRKHCEFWRDGSSYHVRDLGATNPTRVNDMAVTEAVLDDGDHIAVGECLLKFVSPSSVEASYHAEMDQLATNDALTELPNRRHFIDAVDKEILRSLRLGLPLTMCIIDADYFKRVNDEYGHIAGDDVLRELGVRLRSKLRTEDIAGRIGGEEFAVVLPEYSAEQAVELFAEPLRQAIEATPFNVGGEQKQLTISIGVAVLTMARGNRSLLMKAADAALYRAKDEGRNRVLVAPSG